MVKSLEAILHECTGKGNAISGYLPPPPPQKKVDLSSNSFLISDKFSLVPSPSNLCRSPWYQFDIANVRIIGLKVIESLLYQYLPVFFPVRFMLGNRIVFGEWITFE